MRDLASALAQSRMPQGPAGPMPAMPPMPEPQPADVAAGPAEGAVFRQAMNIAAAELGPNAPPQAVQQLAMQILEMAGAAPPQQGMPPQGAPMPPQGMPQGMPQGGPQMGPAMPQGMPMMPPGGMPPRGM